MDRRRGRVVCHLFVITSDTETARGQIRPGENGREYFLQTCQIRGLSGGVNRSCKNSSVYSLSQLNYRQTDRQTDRRKSDLSGVAYYVGLTLAKLDISDI